MQFLFLFMTLSFLTPQFKIEEVRSLFYSASKDRNAASLFKEKMKDVDDSQPVLLGYKAMSEMVMANHSYNPVNKLSYFSDGKELLEKAIKIKPENAELRFLRFSVQTSAPVFLNYKSNIEEDKAVIMDFLGDKNKGDDNDIRRKMKDFLIESRYCNDQEKKLLKE